MNNTVVDAAAPQAADPSMWCYLKQCYSICSCNLSQIATYAWQYQRLATIHQLNRSGSYDEATLHEQTLACRSKAFMVAASTEPKWVSNTVELSGPDALQCQPQRCTLVA